MTSRQIIAASQRNKAYNLDFSTSVKAVMVKINWTTAPVVKITVRKDLKLSVQVVAVVRGQYSPLLDAPMNIAAGKVLHFVSSGRKGWYYIVQVIGNEVRCSCPAHHNPASHGCEHLDCIQMFAERSDQAEFARAGGSAQVELVEVERNGYIYPMYRVVSLGYTGKLHYTWTDDNIINRFPAIERPVIRGIEKIQAWKAAAFHPKSGMPAWRFTSSASRLIQKPKIIPIMMPMNIGRDMLAQCRRTIPITRSITPPSWRVRIEKRPVSSPLSCFLQRSPGSAMRRLSLTVVSRPQSSKYLRGSRRSTRG